MWAARPDDDAIEIHVKPDFPWQVMYDQPENRGTNPHLRTSKYTGYGVVLRAAVDTPQEISIHLQQIDDGPNYRWGVAAEGGCGVVYFFANGKGYSHNGPEDQGDRSAQDTDFCTNFGAWRPVPLPIADQSAMAQKLFSHHDGGASGTFRAIGQNVLSQPVHDLEIAQFAELRSRQGEEAYSWPEYISRSVLLAGCEYFLLYDRLYNQVITHRFSWFVRRRRNRKNQRPLVRRSRGFIDAGKPPLRSGGGTARLWLLRARRRHRRHYDLLRRASHGGGGWTAL
jgi:hypothetical protein